MLLQNSRLQVEILEPGTIYNRSRFDWNGFITQVILDGEHTFCTEESDVIGEGSGGIGLCNEYGIDMPIGYEDAKVGDEFPKIGVGLLKKKDEEEYNFFKDYEIRPFPITISRGSDFIKYIVEPLPCRGYEVREEKTITIADNTLSIDYLIENVGTKPIHTNEYCHNFICINENAVGPNYLLSTPCIVKDAALELEYKDTIKDLSILKNEITWNKVPNHTFYLRKEFVKTKIQCDYWAITHKSSGRVIKEYHNFEVTRFALWGTNRVVSPEMFIDIDLQPGEVKTWRRVYEFV